MHRRDFSTGFIAAGLASPAILTGDKALANAGGGEGGLGSEAVRQFSRIILILGIQRVIITYLLIFNPLGLLGLDLRAPVRQYDENRLSLGKTPLLGGLFRQSLKGRFDPTALVAQVFLFQSMLMVLPLRGPVSNVSKVVIAHRKLSWEPKPKPRKMRMSKIPNLGEIHRNGTLMGGVYQSKSELLVLVRPSIVDPES